MRLTCPKCAAQYDIPTDLIPPEGREVECSSCSHIWHQMPTEPRIAPMAEPVPSPAPDLEESGPTIPDISNTLLRPLPESVLSVLQQEAARELEMRKAVPPALARARDNLTKPPATLPDVPVAPVPAPKIPAPAVVVPAPIPEPDIPPVTALPDADALGSTLLANAASPVPPEHHIPAPAAPVTPIPTRPARGYHRGFATAILLSALAFTLYLIGAAYHSDLPPWAATAMAHIDQLRLWIFDHAARLVDPLVKGLR